MRSVFDFCDAEGYANLTRCASAAAVRPVAVVVGISCQAVIVLHQPKEQDWVLIRQAHKSGPVVYQIACQ